MGPYRNWSELRRLVVIAAITGAVATAVGEMLHHATDEMARTGEILTQAAFGLATVLAVVTAMWRALVHPLKVARDEEQRRATERETQLRDEASKQEYDARLHRALEMASTEQMAFDVVARVLGKHHRDRDAELLVADSSDAHLKRAVAHSPVGGGGCEVVAPHDCPAVRRAQTQLFSSSEEIDSCPQLRGRDRGACSALCVPVNIMGKAVGVIHVTGDEDELDLSSAAAMESLANHAGTRIGMLRVMERTHLQAATDPLTGLLNRRSFENQAHSIVETGRAFSIAMGDLDFFKKLNDVHGHDVGDRALRMFARTLQTAVRADDLVARYGGEEFLILLPDVNCEAAGAILRRVQEELFVAIARGGVPPFTVSFGVASSEQAIAFEDIVRLADSALLQSKRDGRNRVTLAAQEAPAVAG